MKKKTVISILLAGVLTITAVVPAMASSTQSKLNAARNAKEETESSLGAVKNRIQELEEKKSKSETYMKELNSQLELLKGELEDLKDQSDGKKAELKETQKKLQAAIKTEKKQYAAMKLRIQYIYESSASQGYLEAVFGDKNFAKIINRADNVTAMAAYDRDMLREYEGTKKKVARHKAKVKKEKEAVEKLRLETTAKQQEVQKVVQATYDEIQTYKANISEGQSEAADLVRQINAQEEEIDRLIKQAMDEEAAARRAAAARAKAAEEASREEASKGSSGDSHNEDTSSENASASDEGKDIDSSDHEEGKGESVESTSSSGESSASAQNEQEDASSSDEEGESSSGSSASSSGNYLGTFTLTAYCNCSKCCGSWSGGATASGAMPTAGRTVAMGGVPFGTKLMINGNIYTVEDRGTSYGHVDIYMNSHSEALNFGMQSAEVYQVG